MDEEFLVCGETAFSRQQRERAPRDSRHYLLPHFVHPLHVEVIDGLYDSNAIPEQIEPSDQTVNAGFCTPGLCNELIGHQLRILCVSSEVLGQRTYSQELRAALHNVEDLASFRHVAVGEAAFRQFSKPTVRLFGSVAEAAFVVRRVVETSGGEDFDAVILVGWEFLLGLSSLVGHRPTAVFTDMTPRLVTEAGKDGSMSRGKRFARSVLRHAQDTRFHRLAHNAMFVPMSDWCAQSLKDDYGALVLEGGPIPCPLDLTRWTPKKRSLSGQLRVLFVGNDLERKGGFRLLRLFEQHLLEFSSLTMVTQDPAASSLRIPAGVTLMQGYHRDDLISVYQDSDVLVLPTQREPLGHVYGEAAACGVPAVASNIGGVSTLVEDGVSGLLMKPSATDDEWAATLRCLWDDDARLTSLRAGARQLAERKLDVVQFRQRIRGLVEHLTNRVPTSPSRFA